MVLLTPALAFAVSVPGDVILVLPSDSSSYILAANSSFDDLIIGSSSFSFTLSSGQHIALRSADRKDFQNSLNVADTCADLSSELTISVTSTQTFTVTPTGTCYTSTGSSGTSSSNNSGIVSGGGGATYTPAPTPTPAPVPAPQVPAITPPASAPRTLIGMNVGVGSKGNDVVLLQTFLAADPALYPEGIVSGYFGPATQRAVKRFQAKYGISQVGHVGPATRAKLNELFAGASPSAPGASAQTPAPVASAMGRFVKLLIRGTENSDVSMLQELLKADPALYPEGIVSGYFGPATERAVKRFQAKYGISQVGYTGPATRAKLNEVFGR